MLRRALKLLRRAVPCAMATLFALAFTAAPALRADCRPKRVAPSAIPAQAWSTLAYVRAHRTAPPGFQGGRYFGNYGRDGETKLPVEANGRRISYQEWDVRPKRERQSRGPERIVTGDDNRAWYTADHYCTFTEMK
ncbi:MAG: ribonuclease [Holophagaceae bacterium]|nr:ribonuclease [Holophagaceae bacterium]